MARGKALGPVSELQGRVGLRSRSGRAELRFLRIPRARPVRRDQGADQAREPPPVQGHRAAGPRTDSALVREQVAGAEQAEGARARRSRARRLYPLLDLRRSRRVPVAGGGGALLLHDRDLPRQSGQAADAPGPARALGTGRGRGPALLRRRSHPRNPGRVAHAAEATSSRFQPPSSFPTPRPFCLASSSSITRSCCSKPPIIRRRR